MRSGSGARRRLAARNVDLDALGSTVVDLTSAVDALARPAPAARERTGTPALRPARPPRRRRRRAAAPEDDTAYFDPSRADFKSLVRKLDEVLGDD